jgi:outer membrane protein W
MSGESAPGKVNQEAATPVVLPKVEATSRTWGLALGLRSTYYQMTQNTGKIIGNVNLMEEEQNYSPIKPVLQINFSKYLALEFGYDQFKAKALNRAFIAEGISYNEHDPRFSDGAVEWTPYMLALQFRWPHFHKSFVPYLLGGLSYTKTSWTRKEWYYNGFPYPWVYDNWTSQGNRPQDYPNGGYRRIFTVDDHTIGTLLGFGVDYFIWDNLALNLDCRYHWAKVNFTYSLAFDEGRDVVSQTKGTFGLDSWILGLGLKYFF